MLGLSERVHDVDLALTEGPMRFLSLLEEGSELAFAIASAITKRADHGYVEFPVGSKDISDLIGHYLESTFHTSATSRIGAHGVYNFQRLAYNVSACVVSFYDEELRTRSRSKLEIVLSLRRSTELVAIFAGSLKTWMPVSPWFGEWWTQWHVLSYVLEMTSGTVLSESNSKWHRLSFLVFCDTIAGKALYERDTTSTHCITDYKSSSFAWCACSKAWQCALASCKRNGILEWTPNASIFLTVASNMFNSPVETMEAASRPASPGNGERAQSYNQIKRKYESPESDRKVAQRAVVCGVGSPVRSLTL
jgi:hypothetical protein